MAEILYYNNPDLLDFTAEILSVDANSDGFSIVLDRTAFYPEGGGQPADRGSINGFRLTDVRKKDGEIYHSIAADSALSSPAAGTTAECRVDFDHRFDYMQQHSGQHIISAAMMNAAGIETVSVHQGEDYLAVETSAEAISSEVIRKIEVEANAAVRSNTAIVPEWTDAEGLKKYKLRRPSKHSTNIRIIRIAGIDCVACGGMHLKTTADIELIKYSHQEKIRGRIRTFWKIGRRAFADYTEKTGIINSLTELYSARQYELIDKSKAAADSFNELKYRFNKLEEDYASVLASILISEAEKSTGDGVSASVIKVFDDKSRGFISSLLKSLSKQGGSGCSFIFNRNGDTLTWAAAAGEDSGFEFNTFKAEFLPLIDGKGGGRAPLWQGVARNPDGLDAFVDKLKKDLP